MNGIIIGTKRIAVRGSIALLASIAMPEITKSFIEVGLDPANSTVESFTRQYLAGLARWKDVVARAKIPMTD